MNRAIFFDRDGVLTKAVYHEKTKRYGGPWNPNEVQVYSIDCIKKLKEFLFFLVSNQPDAAKGNTSLYDLINTCLKFNEILKSKNIYFKDYFYCFHKKEDNCICRKPSSFFLKYAAEKYNIDLSKSYMLGDLDTDIKCGQGAGVKTFKIIEDVDKGINNLEEIVELILNENILR